MTVPIITTLAIIVIMTISFLTEILPLGFTALMVPVLLQGSGLLTGKEAWAGFSNSTVITWIGLFIIGGVFAKTSLPVKSKFSYRSILMEIPQNHDHHSCFLYTHGINDYCYRNPSRCNPYSNGNL